MPATPATASFPAMPGPVSAQPQPKLLDCLRDAPRSRHYSRRTEQSYCPWPCLPRREGSRRRQVKRFIFFHDVWHPADMGEPEINAYLTRLAAKKKVSASTRNQALSAWLFLYRRDVDRQIDDIATVVRARRPSLLPPLGTIGKCFRTYVLNFTSPISISLASTPLSLMLRKGMAMPPQIICPYCKHVEPLKAHRDVLNLSQHPYSGIYHCQCGANASPSLITAQGQEPTPEKVQADFERGTHGDKYSPNVSYITIMDERVPLYWWK
jgi:hypothetical protein